MKIQTAQYFLLASLTVSLAACEPRESAEARTVETASVPQASKAAAYRFVTSGDANAARYRIREQLVGVDFPATTPLCSVDQSSGRLTSIAPTSFANIADLTSDPQTGTLWGVDSDTNE